jgi:hypothetical protein
MKIKNVEATWLHVPIPEARQHVSDFGRMATILTVAPGPRDAHPMVSGPHQR